MHKLWLAMLLIIVNMLVHCVSFHTASCNLVNRLISENLLC